MGTSHVGMEEERNLSRLGVASPGLGYFQELPAQLLRFVHRALPAWPRVTLSTQVPTK